MSILMVGYKNELGLFIRNSYSLLYSQNCYSLPYSPNIYSLSISFLQEFIVLHCTIQPFIYVCLLWLSKIGHTRQGVGCLWVWVRQLNQLRWHQSGQIDNWLNGPIRMDEQGGLEEQVGLVKLVALGEFASLLSWMI